MGDWLWAKIGMRFGKRFEEIKAKLSKDKNEVKNVQTQAQKEIVHTIEQPTYTADNTDNITTVRRFTASGKVTDKDEIIYDFTASGKGNLYGFDEITYELFMESNYKREEKYRAKKKDNTL